MPGSTKPRRIVAVHLLNNFSGSPMVFAQALKALAARGAEVHLYSSGGPGFLSELPVSQHLVWYAWAPGKYRRLLNYAVSQAILFVRMLRYARQDVSFYVNTLLPAGAALAGKLMG
ncbi:MAG: group 1 glycosyl transferase, partial [Bacteroidetes bacterium]